MVKRGLPDAVAAMMEEARRQAEAAGAEPNSVLGGGDERVVSPDVYAEAMGERRPSKVEPPPSDADLAFYPMTDLGNAERFAARHRDWFRHVAAIGWLFYDGRRWVVEDGEMKAQLAAHNTARAIQKEADAIRGSDRDPVISEPKGKEPVRLSDKLAAWGRTSENAPKQQAMLKLAAPYLATAISDLDADPWKLNVENGTIEIRRDADDDDPIVFRPHDPHDMITKLAPVRFNPTARCPRYDRFMVEVQPSPEMRRFLHQWGGYSLTGNTDEQKLCFWYGKGRNGKSTLVDAWGHVAGDYGDTVPIETFLNEGRGRNAGQATPDLALLPGVRMLRTSEPEKGSKLAEALIKLVTGGEPIQARHLNRDYFKFRPSFKLTMSGNYRPQISGTDEGIWRRVVLVPWSVTVDNPDGGLLETLKGEASGIFNRLLDGLRDYLDGGLSLPSEVAAATRDYRDDSDPLGRFLSIAVERVQDERVASSRMHAVFVAWAKAMGEREWSPKGLTGALKERGYALLRSDGSHWLDVRLLKSEIDFSPPAPPDQRTADR